MQEADKQGIVSAKDTFVAIYSMLPPNLGGSFLALALAVGKTPPWVPLGERAWRNYLACLHELDEYVVHKISNYVGHKPISARSARRWKIV